MRYGTDGTVTSLIPGKNSKWIIFKKEKYSKNSVLVPKGLQGIC